MCNVMHSAQYPQAPRGGEMLYGHSPFAAPARAVQRYSMGASVGSAALGGSVRVLRAQPAPQPETWQSNITPSWSLQSPLGPAETWQSNITPSLPLQSPLVSAETWQSNVNASWPLQSARQSPFGSLQLHQASSPLPHTVPTEPGVEQLEPELVHQLLLVNGCVLIDVRDEDRAAGLIDGAVHVPAVAKTCFADRVPELVQQLQYESVVVFTCQYSAHRAPRCANWYREQAPPSQRVAVLKGGFRGWEATGLPVVQPDAAVTAWADGHALKQGINFVTNGSVL